MSKILSSFGYETVELQLNIYGMAEDVSELTHLMKNAVQFRSSILSPWEHILELWTLFLSIAFVVFLVSYLTKFKKEKVKVVDEPKDKQKETEQLMPSQVLHQLEKDAIEENLQADQELKSEEDTVTLAPGSEN